jgi:hypothetical protein
MASDGVTTPSGQGFFVGFPIPVENRDAALLPKGGLVSTISKRSPGSERKQEEQKEQRA